VLAGEFFFHFRFVLVRCRGLCESNSRVPRTLALGAWALVEGNRDWLGFCFRGFGFGFGLGCSWLVRGGGLRGWTW
jgi:hypothetical protein